MANNGKKIEKNVRQGIWQERHEWVQEVKAQTPEPKVKKSDTPLLLKYF